MAISIVENVINELEKRLNPIANFIKAELIKELEAQGHKLTGDMINSIEIKINKTKQSIDLQGFGNKYGIFLDTGVPANKIPYTRGSGKKKSKYIDALIDYAQKRGMINPKSAAFAIAQKHKQEGMPTSLSYRFSKNNKRTRWLTDTLDNNTNSINQQVENIIGHQLNITIENIIRKTNKSI